MKYILIIGTSDAGKSTTINAICKKLNSTSIQRLKSNKTFEKISINVDILNGTYLVETNGKIILVSAGAPTEQNIKITILIEICLKLKIEIDFALVAMRTVERREDFDTKKELKEFEECILEERIWQLNGADFKNSKEWQGRIEKISELIKNTLGL